MEAVPVYWTIVAADAEGFGDPARAKINRQDLHHIDPLADYVFFNHSTTRSAPG